jgi:hypothetical protein
MGLGPPNPMDTKEYSLNINLNLHLIPKIRVWEALTFCYPYLCQGEFFFLGKTVTNSTSGTADYKKIKSQ